MEKKYLAKIIATDNEGLQTISACCSGGKIKVGDIKYLASNRVFLLSIKEIRMSQISLTKKLIVFVDLILFIT